MLSPLQLLTFEGLHQQREPAPVQADSHQKRAKPVVNVNSFISFPSGSLLHLPLSASPDSAYTTLCAMRRHLDEILNPVVAAVRPGPRGLPGHLLRRTVGWPLHSAAAVAVGLSVTCRSMHQRVQPQETDLKGWEFRSVSCTGSPSSQDNLLQTCEGRDWSWASFPVLCAVCDEFCKLPGRMWPGWAWDL